ncbi:restriction endonuclease [Caenimonas terrae]|uniref:Restriction endonuclease n=1 Tax=Caenimonas terrae TaxID=696074 RepID=A0ABW0NG87_9BURK
MARRRRHSGAEQLMDLVAMLPWWAGVALAVASYFVLNKLSVAPPPRVLQPGQTAPFVLNGMVAALAFAGQFAVPPICIIAALTSLYRRKRREGLVEDVTQSNAAAALNAMSWQEFELLVGEAFRLQGYKVTEQGGAQADGGVDLVLRKGGEIFVVQCKQWKAFKVGVDVIRQLYGVMAASGAAGGFVVTSGTFTEGAEAFAHGRNISLVNGPRLFGMIQQAKESLAVAAPRPAPVPLAPAAPQCPACNASMVRRTAQKGSTAGAQFWGCSRFPACRGTRQV